MTLSELQEIKETGTRLPQEEDAPLLHGGGLCLAGIRRVEEEPRSRPSRTPAWRTRSKCAASAACGSAARARWPRPTRTRSSTRRSNRATPRRSWRRSRTARPPTSRRATRSTRSSPSSSRWCSATAARSIPSGSRAYIAADGYLALRHVLREQEPARGRQVDHGQRPARPRRRRLPDRAEVADRRQGRRGDKKYIVCNADEGDPGAFMDRTRARGRSRTRSSRAWPSPAYAIGAEQGYIYVRAEYPLAIERLQKAIKQAKKAGLLGARDPGGAVQLRRSTSGSAPAPSSAARRPR